MQSEMLLKGEQCLLIPSKGAAPAPEGFLQGRKFGGPEKATLDSVSRV